MRRKALVASLLLAWSSPPAARAQPSAAAVPAPAHRAEVGVHGGYVWTDTRAVDSPFGPGELDLDDSGFWGITLDVNVRPGGQVELLYNRQDTRFTFAPATFGAPERDLVDVAVEYWQIGGLAGVPRGKLLPFVMLTVGATRINYKGVAQDDEWKFSLIFGVGAKAYLNERLGVRVQGRVPFTVVSGGGALACGGGGCFVSVGGSGVAQLDLSGGLFAMF